MADATTSGNLTVHPAAAIFPIMPDSELEEMAKSIAGFGLREKIGIIIEDDGNGGQRAVVLDGRNRMEALRRLNVKDEIILEEFTEVIDLAPLRATPEEYVLLANIERRNLSGQQRRELAGKLAVMLAERQKDLPKEEQTDTLTIAAQKAGVSRRTAASAKKAVLTSAKGPAKKKPSKTKGSAKKPSLTPEKLEGMLKNVLDVVTNSGHNFPVAYLEKFQAMCSTMIPMIQAKIDRIKELEEQQKKDQAAQIAAVLQKSRGANAPKEAA